MQYTIDYSIGKYYLNNQIVQLQTPYSQLHKYTGNYIYDINQFKKDDGTYYSVYGETYEGDAQYDFSYLLGL